MKDTKLKCKDAQCIIFIVFWFKDKINRMNYQLYRHCKLSLQLSLYLSPVWNSQLVSFIVNNRFQIL
jgi:hypothetical protein